MALKKKLYYNLVFASSADVAGANPSSYIKAFVAGSGALGGSAASVDRYGNLMEPNAYSTAGGGNTVVASGALTRQGIGAWFALATQTAGNMVVTKPRTFSVDFVPFASTNSIDPATRARPRVRVRVTPAIASSAILRGTLYVQRQNSLEV